MTVYVGIDIAKDLHFAAIMSDVGEMLDPFPFENNAKGFQTLLSNLSSFSKDDILIGYESTAHYQENLAFFLLQNGFQTRLINPLQTSALRKANIRNTKTDRVDAKLICLTLYQTKNHVRHSISSDELYKLCVSRDNLVIQRSKCKIQFVSFMDRIFPN